MHHATSSFPKPVAGRMPAGLCLFALMLCAAWGTPAATRAQASGPSGSLTGAVRDPNGAAVPGALVTAHNTGTGLRRTAAADAEGVWTVPALPAGSYEVAIEAQGFRRILLRNIQVEAAVPRTLDARLEIGEITGDVVGGEEKKGTPRPSRASSPRTSSSPSRPRPAASPSCSRPRRA
jgi:hypothetical protein